MLTWEKFKNKKICVAVSGGGDSVALLHFLKAHERERGYTLSALHCEHGIRGEESREDMRFVQALCKDWGVPLLLFLEDCPARASREKTSLETAARNFRHECFARVLAEGKADYIALAHHQNDEAETVLFRLARGSALSGAAAMQAENGRYIRPFLTRSQSEILQYLQENDLPYRTDSTNLQAEATRNKLRLEVLPALEGAIPGATENLARFAALAAEDEEYLQRCSLGLIERERGEPCVAFCDEKPLFTRACLAVMKEMGVDKDYTSAHLNALYALQASERGAVAVLPKSLRAEKTKNGLRFFFDEEEEFPPLPKEQPFDEEGFEGGRYEVKLSKTPITEGEGEWKTLRIDGEKLPRTAYFRFRREGDEMKCFGGATKTLKKLFNEREIPPKERAFLPLLAERDSGRVYAVCGVEISETVKVDESTTKVIYITIGRSKK